MGNFIIELAKCLQKFFANIFSRTSQRIENSRSKSLIEEYLVVVFFSTSSWVVFDVVEKLLLLLSPPPKNCLINDLILLAFPCANVSRISMRFPAESICGSKKSSRSPTRFTFDSSAFNVTRGERAEDVVDTPPGLWGVAYPLGWRDRDVDDLAVVGGVAGGENVKILGVTFSFPLISQTNLLRRFLLWGERKNNTTTHSKKETKAKWRTKTNVYSLRAD